jgi:hypothetical protein
MFNRFGKRRYAKRETVVNTPGESTSKFVYYNPHEMSIDQIIDGWKRQFSTINGKHVIHEQKTYRFGSIDPAITNFEIRVEERAIFTGMGRPYVMELHNIFRNAFSETGEKATLDAIRRHTNYPSYLVEISKILDSHIDIFSHCHYIIIERQVDINQLMIRMQQHIITHLMDILKHRGIFPLIVEISNAVKTNALCCPVTGKGIKKWSPQQAIMIWYRTGDMYSIQRLASPGKKDDHADAECQIEAFIRMCGLPIRLHNISFKFYDGDIRQFIKDVLAGMYD